MSASSSSNGGGGGGSEAGGGSGGRSSSSRKVRVKKYIASRGMNTKAGRKAVVGALGDEGELILEALEQIAAIFTGDEQTGAAMRDDILKIAIKAKILWDEKVLTEANTMHARNPVNSVSVQVVQTLNRDKITASHISAMTGNFSRIGFIIKDMLKPHLSEDSMRKVDDIVAFYSKPELVTAFCQDGKYSEQREALRINLSVLLGSILLEADVEASRREPAPCRAPMCNKPRAPVRGLFRGSQFCPRHHLQRSQDLVEHPRLKHFIGDEISKHAAYLVAFLKQYSEHHKKLRASRSSSNNNTSSSGGASVAAVNANNGQSTTGSDSGKSSPRSDSMEAKEEDIDVVADMPTYHLMSAIQTYKGLGRYLRLSRAKAIYDKYLGRAKSNSYVPLPKDLVKSVRNKILMSNADRPLPQSLFNDIHAILTRRMNVAFDAFLKSPIFQQYVSSISLPKYVVNRLRREDAAAAKKRAAAAQKKGEAAAGTASNNTSSTD